MRILEHLKKASFDQDIRWIVKYSKAGKVREIKQLFDPEKDFIEDEYLGFEIVLQKNAADSSFPLNSFKELIWSNY